MTINNNLYPLLKCHGLHSSPTNARKYFTWAFDSAMALGGRLSLFHATILVRGCANVTTKSKSIQSRLADKPRSSCHSLLPTRMIWIRESTINEASDPIGSCFRHCITHQCRMDYQVVRQGAGIKSSSTIRLAHLPVAQSQRFKSYLQWVSLLRKTETHIARKTPRQTYQRRCVQGKSNHRPSLEFNEGHTIVGITREYMA